MIVVDCTYHTTFDGFKVFKTYLKSLTKPDYSIKTNLSLHNMKVCTILEAYLYYCIYILYNKKLWWQKNLAYKDYNEGWWKNFSEVSPFA